jgi:hypothetical protein
MVIIGLPYQWSGGRSTADAELRLLSMTRPASPKPPTRNQRIFSYPTS